MNGETRVQMPSAASAAAAMSAGRRRGGDVDEGDAAEHTNDTRAIKMTSVRRDCPSPANLLASPPDLPNPPRSSEIRSIREETAQNGLQSQK